MININIQVIFMDHSQIQRCHLIRRCPFEKPDLRIFISTVDMTCLITPCSLTPVDLTYTCSLRSAQRLEEPMSREDEDFSEHDYYNSIPGKEPPVGGVVDSRLRPSSSMLGHIHSQPQSKAAAQVWGQSAAATAFTVVFTLGFKVGKVKKKKTIAIENFVLNTYHFAFSTSPTGGALITCLIPWHSAVVCYIISTQYYLLYILNY